MAGDFIDCPRCGYPHPNCKCWEEMPNVPSSAAAFVSAASGGSGGSGGGGGGGAGSEMSGGSGTAQAAMLEDQEVTQLAGMGGNAPHRMPLNFADGGDVPEGNTAVQDVLGQDAEHLGSYVHGAHALGQPIDESLLGDPQVNGEHVLAHTGIQDLLDGKLGNDITRRTRGHDDPVVASVAGLGHVEKLINQHADHMDSQLSGVFGEKSEDPHEKPLSEEEHKELTEKVNNLANNPSALLDSLHNSTAALQNVSPNIASNTQQAATRAINFLSSKAVQPPPDPLGEPYEASQTERSQFQRYLNIVENPATALHEIKTGTLTPETVETLKVVYPKLYDNMKQGILENLGTKVPYQRVQSLSQFLGSPLDSSLTPQRIQSIQSSINSDAAAQQAQSQGPQKGTKVRGSGLAKIDLASRTSLTPNEEN